MVIVQWVLQSLTQQTVASPITGTAINGIADEGGADNCGANYVLIGEAVMFSAGRAALLGALALA